MDGSKKRLRDKNPRENANILSIATFFYTIPTFLKGFKNDFKENDLYETYSSHKSDLLGNKIEKLWNKEVEDSKAQNKRPSLGKVLFKLFGFDYVCIGIGLLFNEIVVKTLQVLALGELVSLHATNNSKKNYAYVYAVIIILCSFFVVLIGHPTSMGGYHLGIKIRIACCSLIYRKAIKLSKVAFEKTTSGKIVNLISNDLKNFESCFQMSNFIWIGPLQTIFLSYFMYSEAGYSSIFGLMFLSVFIPLHFYMAKITSVYRAKSATRTDERIRLMNEIINGIYVIKMFTWEQLFIKLILLYRMLEMKAIRINAHLKGIYSACVNFNSRIAIFLTILSYVLINNRINAKQVFVLTGLYNLLRQTMLVCFPYGITLAAETNVCLKRINDFLLLEEISNTSETIDLQNEAISLRNISAQWSKTSQPILSKINLNIPVGKLTAIIGSVGSGKSSLLNVILKEIPITEGDVLINGRVSYAVQEPWLFHQNVQQNILFGSKLDHRRYQEVVKSCALETDFRRLPHSDLSMVSERGASLSGGQKARINLARAVYKDADIYLLDDPLSGVDVHVGKQIFENCIKTLLKGKTVVLVTHQLNYLSNANHIVVLEKGSIVAQGTFSELQKCNSDFAKYLRTESNEHNFNKTTKLESSKVSVSERKIETLTEAPEKIIIGSVSRSVYRKYIRSGANLFCASAILAIFIALQILVSGLDYFLAYWVNIKQTIGINRSQYKLHLMIYSGFIIVIVFMSLLRSFLFVEMCTKASIYLHNTTFRNVIHATLKFFLSNPSGRILNRFSKDMGTIDELLSTCIMDTIIIGLVVLGIVVVTIIVNVWLILPILVISIVFYYLRILYIGTSRSIKRLEAVTKSPMIEYLNATVRGLTTIRAAGTQHILIEEFDNHHDLNTSASFLFLATSKAFGFWLDMVCAVYITIVTLSCLFSENEVLGGNVGLIISQALMLTGLFQWGIRQLTELENQMTSVERILDYDTIELEDLNNDSKNVLNQNWPKNGKIQFANVSLSYFPDAKPVLKNVSFEIAPLQKVGVVGRTGAGKSSLIYAFLRLADIEGTILIDDVDTKSISLQQLRSKLSIIPQEPVLFSGSLRNNLDPFHEYTDDILWDAIEKVEMKDTIAASISGLDMEIFEGGSNLSVGQRQLLCLARALLCKNVILVLDEATANVDHLTDVLIQNTIRKQFTSCTVVVISHRLDNVIDCDKMLVIDAGEMVEFGYPYELLQNVGGVFYKMVEQTGNVKLRNFTHIARSNYDRRCM